MYRVRTSFVVGVLAGALVAAPALAQNTVWNFNVFGPPRAVTAGLEAMAEFYKKESNGKLEIKIHYGAALGPEKQMPEGIKSGGYEGALLCGGYYPNKFPLLTAMELPFLPPRGLAANAIVNQAFLEHPAIVKEAGDRWNVKYFGPIVLPPFEFMGNKKIASVADMKGVKMRITGLNAKALQTYGATPVMVTAPEGYQALERGTIDSFGFPYTFAFGAYKLYEVSKHVTEGLAMSGFMCFEGVSQKAWDALPDNLKAKLPQAQELARQALFKAYKKDDDKWLPIFKQKLEITQFPAAERDKLVAASANIWTAWAKENDDAGRPGTEILNFVKASVSKAEAQAAKAGK